MVQVQPSKSLVAMMILVALLFLSLSAVGFAAEVKGLNEANDPWRTMAFRQADLAAHKGGNVHVQLNWLERPGDFALTISYWGPLTQEGPVNVWMRLNGMYREMLTLAEMPDRRQQLIIYSSQPTMVDEQGRTVIRQLESWERVDPGLFAQAAYYPQFGQNSLEFKFFANGRWEGDPHRENENYVLTFVPPVL